MLARSLSRPMSTFFSSMLLPWRRRHAGRGRTDARLRGGRRGPFTRDQQNCGCRNAVRQCGAVGGVCLRRMGANISTGRCQEVSVHPVASASSVAVTACQLIVSGSNTRTDSPVTGELSAQCPLRFCPACCVAAMEELCP
jgi:hypothetical protein